jgi:hypothetical protein
MTKVKFVANLMAESNEELDNLLVDLSNANVLAVHLRQVSDSGGFPEYAFIGERDVVFELLKKHSVVLDKEEFDEFVEELES